MGDAPPPYPGTTGGDFTKVPLGDAPTTNHQQSYGIGTNNNRFEFTVSTGAPQPLNAPPPIVVRAVHARTALFGPYPVEMDCPYCRKHIVTHTDTVAGALPWIIMGVCFVLGFFLLIPWCLCCLPFCIDSCLDVNHSCPSCKRLVGRFVRL